MKMYQKPMIIVAALWLTGSTACNDKGSAEEKAADVALQRVDTAVTASEYSGYAADSIAPQAPAGNHTSPQQAAAPAPAPEVDWDKKIVKNATLTIEVKKHDAFNTQLHNLVKQAGGYIAEEQQNKSDYKIENTVTIKVPVDQFDNLVTAISATRENITEQRITSQDVTGEVFDTRSRIEAKKQVRARYMELLKQAKTMADILKVQKEINDIQVDIESGAGRVNYLTHAAAFSTVQLTFYEVLDSAAAANENNSPGFGKRVLNALHNGWDWMSALLVVLLTLWPLWAAAGIGVWGYKRWKKNTKPAKP